MNSRRVTAGSLTTAAIALAAVLAACEGSNLFEGQVVVDAPEILSVTAPNSVDVPADFDITATAIAPGGMDRVVFVYSALPIDPDTVEFNGETNQVNATVNVQVPVLAADTFLIVSVTARDIGGRVSPAFLDTVFVNVP